MSPALPAQLRHPTARVADLAIVAVLAVPVLATAITLAPASQEPLAGLLGVAALVSILARRRQPLAALGVAAVAGTVMPGAGPGVVPALVILYTIATRRPWPALTPAAAAVAVVAASVVGQLASTHPGHVDQSIGVAIECAAAIALGLYISARRAYIDALRDRANRADRERELMTGRAVAVERLRIAQDLHDVVAHNVSLIVVQAQALGVTVDDERVRSTTDAIADLGRQAMTEMHRTLRLVRDIDNDAAQRAPQPSLANLDKLIEQSRAGGMIIELTIEGEPRELAQTVDLSAFRIIQEALTNVIKHAGCAHTTVTVSYEKNALGLQISDHGDGHRPSPPAGAGANSSPGGGHGVIGMRERAALFGGTLTAEPGDDHGFDVKALLPYADPSIFR